jgi:hypothetical protein
MDGECVDVILQFARQRHINHAVAFDPGLSVEGFRHDIKTEMRFPAGTVASVAFVQVRFIFDMQTLRREGSRQFRRNNVLHAHNSHLTITAR